MPLPPGKGIRRLVLPEQDTHLEHSRPPRALQSPPPLADLNHLEGGLLNTHGSAELPRPLEFTVEAVSSRVCLVTATTHWQGLHFSWCHLLGMMNTTAINHAHEAFG